MSWEEVALSLERELAGGDHPGRCGVIFQGTAGSGKTWLLHGLKDKLQERAVYVDCSRLLERYVGDQQRSILAMFEDYRRGQQSKVFLWDNVDSLFLDGDSGPVPSFSSLAFLSGLEDMSEGHFIVATCTSAVSLPPGITLSHHLGVPRALLPPSAPERSDMFYALLSDNRLQVAEAGDAGESLQDVCDELSLRTQGFSASDVLQLVRVCIYDSMAEQFCSRGPVPVRVSALFQQAAAIQPSAAQASGAPSRAARPAVLVGLEVEQARLLSLLCPPSTSSAPSRPCRGILIHGPSGCGKSSLANWLAFSVRHRFRLVTVSCAELVHKVVGESERRIAACFQAARAMAPCLLLLDNIEIVLGGDIRGREGGGSGSRGQRASHPALDRLLSSLLVEIDGLGQATGPGGDGPVVVIATAASVASLDKALSRPGRLEEHVALPLPGPSERLLLLRHLAEQVDPSVLVEGARDEAHCSGVLERAAQALEGHSHAAIINAVQAACFQALAAFMRDRVRVSLHQLFSFVT